MRIAYPNTKVHWVVALRKLLDKGFEPKKFGSGVRTPENAEPNLSNLNLRFRFRFREITEPNRSSGSAFGKKYPEPEPNRTLPSLRPTQDWIDVLRGVSTCASRRRGGSKHNERNDENERAGCSGSLFSSIPSGRHGAIWKVTLAARNIYIADGKRFYAKRIRYQTHVPTASATNVAPFINAAAQDVKGVFPRRTPIQRAGLRRHQRHLRLPRRRLAIPHLRSKRTMSESTTIG
ncbi:hypothetical protein C8R45DRAFT_1159481 [Mycena sanguinolenta]|nr:hypothetical protein C8R45DRAFT_1159481 [Mycena sanguinolenta]